MQPLQVFQFRDVNVRTVMQDGNPWWIARDVCDVLGIANASDALLKLDDDEKGVALTDTLGGKQTLATVNEPGLYALILRSRKPAAKDFKRWVTHDVIPSIRRTGAYAVPGAGAPLSEVDKLAQVLQVALPGMQQGIEEARKVAAEAKALAEASQANTAKVTQEAANILRWDQARAAKLRVTLEKLCREYGRLRELNGFGGRTAETIAYNRRLKDDYGKRDLLTVSQLEKAIAHTQSLITDLPDPERGLNLTGVQA